MTLCFVRNSGSVHWTFVVFLFVAFEKVPCCNCFHSSSTLALVFGEVLEVRSLRVLSRLSSASLCQECIMSH